jgi:hypothetical protein
MRLWCSPTQSSAIGLRAQLSLKKPILLQAFSPRIIGTAHLSTNRFSHCIGNFFASHISVALDEGTAFKIEELADLKWIRKFTLDVQPN